MNKAAGGSWVCCTQTRPRVGRTAAAIKATAGGRSPSPPASLLWIRSFFPPVIFLQLPLLSSSCSFCCCRSCFCGCLLLQPLLLTIPAATAPVAASPASVALSICHGCFLLLPPFFLLLQPVVLLQLLAASPGATRPDVNEGVGRLWTAASATATSRCCGSFHFFELPNPRRIRLPVYPLCVSNKEHTACNRCAYLPALNHPRLQGECLR